MNKHIQLSRTQRGFSTPVLMISILGLSILLYFSIMYVTEQHSVHPSSTMISQGKNTSELTQHAPIHPLAPASPIIPTQPNAASLSPAPLMPRSASHKPPASAPTAASPVEGTTAVSEQRMKRLNDIEAKLQRLIAAGHGKMDPAKLDPVLKELQNISDQHGRVGGVDIGVLRRNLKRVSEMQKLALKAQQLAKKSAANRSAADVKALQSISARLLKLQKEMEPVTVSTPTKMSTTGQTGVSTH